KAQRAIWRRRLIRLTLCLLLGAVTTVGVAWGDKWVYDHNSRRNPDATRSFRPDVINLPSYFGFIEVRSRGYVRTASIAMFPRSDEEIAESPRREDKEVPGIPGWIVVVSRDDPSSFTRTLGAGRPMVALTGVNEESPDARGWLRIGERRLPIRPYLPGFIVNTLGCAAPLWLLLNAAGFVRRWSRRRRNRCVACGYDLRGLGEKATCPECGA